ncbi:CTP synthase 1-B [Nymphon striatum]|nr:CTP synthase 1-B [Nymphon striatum]
MASSNARYDNVDNVDNVSDTLSSSSEISEDEIDLSSCEDYCEEIGGWGKCVEPYKFQPLKSLSTKNPLMSANRFCTEITSQAMKYVLVTGGVISGIGKGIIASSIGTLLKSCKIHVTSIKIDPYINIDAGTFSPYEHGEVFVLDDGGEVDLDLGNYERFLDVTLHSDNNITTGKIYQHVINKERQGAYLGKTVQVVPHITDAIQEWVTRVAKVPVSEHNETPEVCIIELGGTIGDIEGMPFVEAFRQFQFKVKRENFCCVHVSLVPQPRSTGEHKTKPTQNSVIQLRGLGLTPDLIVCRSENEINQSVKEKISNSCHVEPDDVLFIQDCSSIYEVPLKLEEQNLISYFIKRLHLNVTVPLSKPHKLLSKWQDLAERQNNFNKSVSIALGSFHVNSTSQINPPPSNFLIFGTEVLEDAYASVTKSLKHAALAANRKLEINYIEAHDLEIEMKEANRIRYHEAWGLLCKSNGILVPGGFGSRGLEGKICAAEWARKTQKPYLGVCYGFQCSVIEFARNVLNYKDANTTEVNEYTSKPVKYLIYLDLLIRFENAKHLKENEKKMKSRRKYLRVIEMPEHNTGIMGGTMRLGKRTTIFKTEKSILRTLYGGANKVHERHRHRYEVNPKFVPEFEAKGMKFCGQDEEGERMEIMELEGHPFYVGVQFHPEYISRPMKPSPPYLGLILASCGKLDSHLTQGYLSQWSTPTTESDDEEKLKNITQSLQNTES